MSESADSEAEDLLHGVDLRRTPVRMGVLKVLAGARRPLDVLAIQAKLPVKVDAVTVYRTLNTFTKKHLAHRVRGEDRSWRYAAANADGKPEHEHPHFVCDNCGKVDCLNDSTIPANLVRQLSVSSAYTVTFPEVVLHGRCPKCS